MGSGNFDLLSVAILPPRPQRLGILDADVSSLESVWPHELFIGQSDHTRWPCLQQLEILLGSIGRDVDLTVPTTMVAKLRGLMNKMSFEVTLGIDGESHHSVLCDMGETVLYHGVKRCKQ